MPLWFSRCSRPRDVRLADSKASTAHHLEREPGFSIVALDNDAVIGCAMCRQDGRRGYLHAIVLPEYQQQDIASELVERCLSKLESTGIFKTPIDVLADNTLANEY